VQDPIAMTHAKNHVLTTDPDLGVVIAIDTTNGNRSIVSGPARGDGPTFGVPLGIVAADNGKYYVADPVNAAVVEIAPRDGRRTALHPAAAANRLKLQAPVGLAQDGAGNLVIADLKARTIYSIDLKTKHMRPLSGPATGSQPATGSGPAFKRPWGVAVAMDGAVYISDSDLAAIFRIDPATGDRTMVLPQP